MDAGRMDRRITIVRETETGRDAFNEPIYSTTLVSCMPVTGSKP